MIVFATMVQDNVAGDHEILTETAINSSVSKHFDLVTMTTVNHLAALTTRLEKGWVA